MKLIHRKMEGEKRKAIGISVVQTKYKLMKRFLLFICFSGMAVFLQAQNPVANQVTEDLLESVGENMSDDTDIQELLDDLEGFSQNPLKIN